LIIEKSESYSLDVDKGIIMSQEILAGKSIARGSILSFIVSAGPDPDEHLILPVFTDLKRTNAEEWIKDKHAENMSLALEFSSTIPKDEFVRIEFRSSEINQDNYRRRDHATIYYSKGVQVFEKNIEVPNFAGKNITEAESWAQANNITLNVGETDSNAVEQGFVISQNVEAGAKIAKHDELTVTISLGKTFVIPDFSQYTVDTAAIYEDKIRVITEVQYHKTVAYGQLISQSIPAGTKIFEKDMAQGIVVIYSLWHPFLKDFRGQTEGEFNAAIFNDYVAKGANLSYETVYVDSDQPKGTIVSMSDYGRFIPLIFHVTIEVSKGNLKPPDVSSGSSSGSSSG
jgi:serine/threonine-protein kinase